MSTGRRIYRLAFCWVYAACGLWAWTGVQPALHHEGEPITALVPRGPYVETRPQIEWLVAPPF